MNHPLEKRHETCEEELTSTLTTNEETREALAEARRTAFALESQDGKVPDAAVGRARREIKYAEKALRELGDRHAKLAGEELATRYALAEEELKRERRANEELKEQETSLAARYALAEGQLAEAEAGLRELGGRGRRLVLGPLKTYLESGAKEALAIVTKAKRKVRELTDQLARVRTERAASTARLAFLAARLEETLGLGESHLRALDGSPEEIRQALADPHVTADRAGIEDLLAKWEAGISEIIAASVYGGPARPVTFYVREVRIFYWFDNGQIAARVIFAADDGRGTEWPRSLRHANFDDAGTRRLLEAERAGAPS